MSWRLWGQEFRFFRDEVIAALIPIEDEAEDDIERDQPCAIERPTMTVCIRRCRR